MRSLWKGSFVSVESYDLLRKKNNKNIKNKKVIISSRRSTILSSMLGHTFSVYNGRNFLPLILRGGMLGYKVGDFIFTKRTGNRIHSEKRKKKIIKK